MSGCVKVLGFVMALLNITAATEFASQLRKCRVDNKVALNSCLFQTFEDLRPSLRTGIPELSLPPLEPMNMHRIAFRQGDGAIVNVQSIFTDVTVTGLSNFTTNFVDADAAARQLRVSLTIPALRVRGLYQLSGQFLFIPAEGSGTFWANFDGVDATGASQMNVVAGADGRERLWVNQTNIDFTISRMSVHLDNLFNGDELLGPVTNHFINENGREILRDVKPEVVKRLNDLVQKVMNDALSQLPVGDFLITGA